jgi:hypothetical protein
MAAALRLYASLGFVREHDVAPIRVGRMRVTCWWGRIIV